jgi:hypothetical protein
MSLRLLPRLDSLFFGASTARARARFAQASKAGLVALGLVAVASCGSRTGLFGVDDGANTLPDGAPLTDAQALSDAQPDGFVPCMPGTFTFVLATAQLMFVIDRSGSMAFSVDGQMPTRGGGLPPGVSSRWDTLREALFQTITPLDNELAIGAKFFPEPPPVPQSGDPEEQCATDMGVGIPPARGNVASIINVFDTTDPGGGTPTEEAIRLAAQYLSTTRGVARTIVLATDGAPNCNSALDNFTCVCTGAANTCADPTTGPYQCLDDQRTVAAVKDVFDNQNIPVYVIGIGGTERPEFLQVLDDMAVAGGRPRATTPKHYNVQSETELQDALQSISDSIAKCTYLTPSAPTDPNAITVQIGGVTIPRDPTHMNGWDWVDKAFGELAFFGASCTAASMSTATATAVTGVVTCQNP